MLADVVREAFAGDPDVAIEELAGRGSGGDELAAAIRRAAPDVVILGALDPDSPPWGTLSEPPGIVALCLLDDARQAWVCEPLGEVSLAGLRAAVREAAARRGRVREWSDGLG